VGQTASFQLCLSARSGVALSTFCFSSLAIYFYDESSTPLIVRNSSSGGSNIPSKAVQRIDLGDVSAFLAASKGDSETGVDRPTIETNLQWHAGSSIVFAGTMSSNVPIIMKVCRSVFSACICGSTDFHQGNESCSYVERRELVDRDTSLPIQF
jgi:trafficking protein particle complex subunit 11